MKLLRKRWHRREKAVILAVLTATIVLCLALGTVLGVFLVRERAERARLEAERERLEAEKPLTPLPGNHPSRLSGYRLLAEGVTDFNIYYYGDETMLGEGASDLALKHGDVSAAPYRLQLREALRTQYAAPEQLAGRICPVRAPSFERGAAEFAAYHDPVGMTEASLNFRLAVLAPGAANETASAESAMPYGHGFAADLETLVRSIRARSVYCDILLVVPHSEDATSPRAAAILALGEYYGLVTVDMRARFAEGGLVHTEGAQAGLANDQGHAAYAEAIATAIFAAAAEGLTAPAIPAERLYPTT